MRFTHTLSFGDDTIEFYPLPDAGVSFGGGERWFGARIMFRRAGKQRTWRHLVAVDVHPFDGEAVLLALRAHLANERARAAERARA